jgi:hypothetical protein
MAMPSLPYLVTYHRFRSFQHPKEKYLSRALQRAERLATTVAGGADILSFLRKPAVLDRMVTAAEHGRPCVEAVAVELRELFPAALQDRTARQAIGTFIAGAMENDRGYEVARSAVRVNDEQFQRGAVYRKASSPVPRLADGTALLEAKGLADRIVLGLTRSECEDLVRAMTKKFPDLLD